MNKYLIFVGAIALASLQTTCEKSPEPSTVAPQSGPHGYLRSDLRLATPSQMALAAAKIAYLCGNEMPGSASEFVSGAMLLGAYGPSLNEVTATYFACALDAPSEGTCDTFKACATGTGVSAPDRPVCDGNLLRVKMKSRPGATELMGGVVACPVFQSSCFSTPVEGICAESLCDANETYKCDEKDERKVWSCVSGLRVAHVCGRGRVCGENEAGIVDCVGKGPVCSGDERCDGDVAVQCARGDAPKGKEARVDCAEWNLGCSTKKDGFGVLRAACIPKLSECESKGSQPSCDGDRFALCVNNKKVSFSCAELGQKGTCKSSSGATVCQE